MQSRVAEIKKIAEEVNDLLKSGTVDCPPVISLNDIIPRREIPYFRIVDYSGNIEKYGKERVLRYQHHMEKLEKIRNKLKTLEASPFVAAAATTFCGFGECEETSNRALLELLVRLTAANIKTRVTVIKMAGKQQLSFDKNLFYGHAFVIIGEIPDNFLFDAPFDKFKEFGKTYILLDPSLGLVKTAEDVKKTLEENFTHQEINKIINISIFDTLQNLEQVKGILDKARVLSAIIRKDLENIFKDTDVKEVADTRKVTNTKELANASIAILNSNSPTFFNINWSTQKNFTSANSSLCGPEEYKPQKTVLLLPEASPITWEKIEKLYDPATDTPENFMESSKL